jgi:hypothetical protein
MDMISDNEFWKWAYSDFLSNTQRGVLAEYIVAKALGCTNRNRVEWDAYDLDAGDGLKIEVKSAAYVQAWAQGAPSAIRFDIAHKRSWFAESNTYAAEAARSADIYVFCVFATRERSEANPLDTGQWFFLACKTDFLNERFPAQKTVALSSLEAQGLERLSFEALGEHVRALGANSSLQRTP